MLRWILEIGALLIMLVYSANSQALTIDSFDGNMTVSSVGAGDEDVGVLSTSSAIGGTRAIKTQVTSGPSKVEVETLIGILYHSQNAQTSGNSRITWDGDSNPNGIDFSGLGGINLLQDNATALKVRVLSLDLSAQITVTLYDAADASGQTFSQGTVVLPVINSPEEVLIPFNSLNASANGPANLSNIGAITLFINGLSPDVDLALEWIGTNGICELVPDQNGRVIDECGVCGGDNTSCAGCDGIPNSGTVPDQCGVCGGNNSTCTDCSGALFGQAVLDRCGVCGGDGESCLSCRGVDIGAKLAALDGGAKKQERIVDRILGRIKPYAKTSKVKKTVAALKAKAHETQIRNWTISWTFPQISVSCANTDFCFSISNESKMVEYRIHSEELRVMAYTAADLLKSQKKSALNKLEKSYLRAADRQHKENMDLADTVPLLQSACS